MLNYNKTLETVNVGHKRYLLDALVLGMEFVCIVG